MKNYSTTFTSVPILIFAIFCLESCGGQGVSQGNDCVTLGELIERDRDKYENDEDYIPYDPFTFYDNFEDWRGEFDQEEVWDEGVEDSETFIYEGLKYIPGLIALGYDYTSSGIHPSRKDDDPVYIKKTIQRKDGEPYTGCTSIITDYEGRIDEIHINHFENGVPTLHEKYELNITTEEEHLMRQINFKDGLLHGKFFEKVFQEEYEEEDGMYMEVHSKEKPLFRYEGSFFNGLRDGVFTEYTNVSPDGDQGNYDDKTHLNKNFVTEQSFWEKGKRVGTWIENIYSNPPVKTESKETVYYRNQILSTTEFEGDGKFSSISIFGKYFSLSDFPDYDGYGDRTFLDKFSEEGKSQIDKQIEEGFLLD
mgnify:CR=1 FL=1